MKKFACVVGAVACGIGFVACGVLAFQVWFTTDSHTQIKLYELCGSVCMLGAAYCIKWMD